MDIDLKWENSGKDIKVFLKNDTQWILNAQSLKRASYLGGPLKLFPEYYAQLIFWFDLKLSLKCQF